MVEYGFRQLIVWQLAMRLAIEVHRLSQRLPSSERFELAKQMRRAAASIPANIAEGNGRAHVAEYLHFLSIARGSLMELDTHLDLAEGLGYLTPADSRLSRDLISRVRQLLSRLTQALRHRKPETGNRTPVT